MVAAFGHPSGKVFRRGRGIDRVSVVHLGVAGGEAFQVLSIDQPGESRVAMGKTSQLLAGQGLVSGDQDEVAKALPANEPGPCGSEHVVREPTAWSHRRP